MTYFRPARLWLMPMLVVSQAVPVFALAPILTLWLGYGIDPKSRWPFLLFISVTAAFYDGLRRTDPGWIDLARVMNASRSAELRHIRLPAALPALDLVMSPPPSPPSARWSANGRIKRRAGIPDATCKCSGPDRPDVRRPIYAAVMACVFYFAIDTIARRLTPWQTEISIEKEDQ